jgi:hypothetical protein
MVSKLCKHIPNIIRLFASHTEDSFTRQVEPNKDHSFQYFVVLNIMFDLRMIEISMWRMYPFAGSKLAAVVRDCDVRQRLCDLPD